MITNRCAVVAFKYDVFLSYARVNDVHTGWVSKFKQRLEGKLKEKLPILLLKPAFGVSTAWAYSHWQHSREIPAVRYQAQEFAGQIFVNDLERPAFEKFAFLAQLKMWLLKQAEVGVALMSGSGSAVFAVLRENADANVIAIRARAELDPELWTSICETIG